jgi:hypothetical protein
VPSTLVVEVGGGAGAWAWAVAVKAVVTHTTAIASENRDMLISPSHVF